jgi:hypothetical protein
VQVTAPAGISLSAGTLSRAQLAQVAKLAATDQHVRAHELAHLAAAGPYARGGPSYTMQIGPDGQAYAVAGEVSLDVSPVPGDPQATIQKAETIRAAANAPSDPSTQDRQVAQAASLMETQAELEIAQEQRSYGQSANPQTGTVLSLLL